MLPLGVLAHPQSHPTLHRLLNPVTGFTVCQHWPCVCQCLKCFPDFLPKGRRTLRTKVMRNQKYSQLCTYQGILHELNQSISLRKPSKESIMCLLFYVRKVRIREDIAFFFVTWLLNVVSVLFDFKAHFSVLCPKPVVL